MLKQAVILAGGRGERLGYITDSVPKPLVEVGGKPFLQYSIRTLEGEGFKDIVILVGYLASMFEPLKSSAVRLVTTKDNYDEAVLSIPGLNDDFLLINGDCYPIMEWSKLQTTPPPYTTVKVNDRDAGWAAVRKLDIEQERIHCNNIKAMEQIYPRLTIFGGLHVGTPQGLQRARTYVDIACYGQ